jgi:hypothetical protein
MGIVKFRRMKPQTLRLVLSVAAVSWCAILRPFPRIPVGGNTIQTRASAPNDSDIQAQYRYWRNSFVVEYPGEACVAENTVRTSPPDPGFLTNPDMCVSSELSYGMLLAVYLDNDSNSTHALFDKFLATREKYTASNGLCGWEWAWTRIDSSSHKDTLFGPHSATDAELDAALALLLASRQWNDDTYRQRAKKLLDAIWKWELDSTLNLKPGDDWDSAKNPSYLNFAAFHVFSSADSPRWDSLAANSWRLLWSNISPDGVTFQLPSDWCTRTGVPCLKTPGSLNTDKIFHSNAIRVPWRLAIDESWYGDAAAKTIDSTIAAWASSPWSTTGGDVRNLTYEYFLDGTPAAYGSLPSFTAGAFGSAGLVDGQFQAWVDSCYSYLSHSHEGGGYLASLNLLHQLLMAGQFENLWASATTSVSSGKRGFRHAPSREGVAFRVESISPPRLLDISGRPVPSVVQRTARGNWLVRPEPFTRGILLVEGTDGSGHPFAEPTPNLSR